MVKLIRSNTWTGHSSCPIDSYTVNGVLQLTKLHYQMKSDKLFDTYTFSHPPKPFTKLEFVVLNPSVYGQFRGVVKEITYAQAKGAQQMLNNWLAGKAGCIANVDLGEPWEKRVQSKTVTFKGGQEEFLFNLSNTYGHGIQKTTSKEAKGLKESGFYILNIDGGALAVYNPDNNVQYYLQRFVIPSLETPALHHMNQVLDKIIGPPISVEAYGTHIGTDKAALLNPLIKEGYVGERLGNELRLYKVIDEGKVVIVQYHLETGVIVVTSIGGVNVTNFLGLQWVKQHSNQLFSQYLVSTGLNTTVPTYAYETPTPLSYILGGVRQEGTTQNYQAMGNFGFALATEATVSALAPLIGYIFKLEGNTLKIFMLVDCLCDTENLFTYHLVQLDSSIAYFCGTCDHKMLIENL